MLILLRYNSTGGHHGFGENPELQFAPGQTRLVDIAWLDAFNNEPFRMLFTGPSPKFSVVRDPAALQAAIARRAEEQQAAADKIATEAKASASFGERLLAGTP